MVDRSSVVIHNTVSLDGRLAEFPVDPGCATRSGPPPQGRWGPLPVRPAGVRSTEDREADDH